MATLIHATVTLLATWALYELIVGTIAARRGNRWAHAARVEDTRRHFAKVRSDLLALAASGDIDSRSALFRFVYSTSTYVMRRPDQYDMISLNLLEAAKNLDGDELDRPTPIRKEVANISPAARQVVVDTISGIAMLMFDYSRVFRLLLPAAQRFGFLMFIFQHAKRRAEQRKPSLGNMERVQERLRHLIAA